MANIGEEKLEQLLTRLENACKVLENRPTTNLDSAMLSTEKIAAFSNYWNNMIKLLHEFTVLATKTVIPDIETITDLVIEAICAHQDLLLATETFVKPQNTGQVTLVKRLSSIFTKVADIGKNNRAVANHSDAVRNGLDALMWIFNDDGCADVTQTYLEAIDFGANRIFKEKIKEQTDWIKGFKLVIKEVNELVTKNYKCGIVWNSKGDSSIDNLYFTIGTIYRKNFKLDTVIEVQSDSERKVLLADITTGTKLKSLVAVFDTKKEEVKTAVKQVVKKDVVKEVVKEVVKPEVKVVKGPKGKVTGLVPRGRRATLLKKGVTEKLDMSSGRSMYVIENCEDASKVVENQEKKTIVQISNCINSTIEIKCKVNALQMMNCENCKIMVDSLVSMAEITNSTKCSIGVKGTVSAFCIDSSDNITVHLCQESADAQFINSKSNDILIRLQKPDDVDDDYFEYAVPEQFVFKINKERKGLDSKVSDLYR